MRLLHIVHQFAPDHVGGTEIYTETVARHQQSLGHEVTVFTRSPGRPPGLHQEDRAALPVVRWRAPPLTPTRELARLFRDPPLERAFDRLLERLQPDLIHIQHLKGLSTRLIDLARARQIPLVLTLHDYWLRCANAQLLTNDTGERCAGPSRYLNCGRCAAARLGGGARMALAPLAAPPLAMRGQRLAAVARQVDRLIAPSIHVRDTMMPLAGEAKRITLLRHGIVVPPHLPPHVPRSGPLRVSYLGGIAPQKGVHVAVEAAAALPADELRLTIYGSEQPFPAYVASLRARAGEGLQFGGLLSRAALWEALAATDLLLVPSLWDETAGLVVQEALAARVPVLASRVGALPEAIRHEETGLLLPPGDPVAWRDALRALVAQPERLARWRAAIGPVRRLADHVHDLDRLYHAVLAERGPV